MKHKIIRTVAFHVFIMLVSMYLYKTEQYGYLLTYCIIVLILSLTHDINGITTEELLRLTKAKEKYKSSMD